MVKCLHVGCFTWRTVSEERWVNGHLLPLVKLSGSVSNRWYNQPITVLALEVKKRDKKYQTKRFIKRNEVSKRTEESHETKNHTRRTKTHTRQPKPHETENHTKRTKNHSQRAQQKRHCTEHTTYTHTRIVVVSRNTRPQNTQKKTWCWRRNLSPLKHYTAYPRIYEASTDASIYELRHTRQEPNQLPIDLLHHV